MRTIKFRVWYSDCQKWLTTNCGRFVIDQTGNLFFKYIGESELELICDSVIEQFTGLTDKNGKEIYEGDIVNVKLRDCYSELFTVVFVDSQARFSFLDKDGIQWLVSSQNEIEVIGNIHDNPELLESK